MAAKKSEPFISVIMCVFNTKEEYLITSVKSILGQTYINFEFIIVDDYSSTDLFKDDVFKDKRITIIKNESNKGPSYSRNKAIDASKGKYIAIMDSDDISLPSRLEKQVIFMENNRNVVACGTWFRYVGFKNHSIERTIDDNEYYKCCLIFGNDPTIINSSVMIRSKALKENGIRYDESKRFGEDYKLWIQLSRVGEVTNYKEILLLYRVHGEQVTFNNTKNRQSAFCDNMIKQEEVLDKLQLILSEEEKDLYFNYLHSKKYNVKGYIKVLYRILDANRLSHVYSQDKLEQRIHEQWVSAIQHIKNPFVLFPLIFAHKHNKKELLRIKIRQIVNKIKL